MKKLALTPEDFKGYTLENKAVLIHTGWDRHWCTDYYSYNYPYFTQEAALST